MAIHLNPPPLPAPFHPYPSLPTFSFAPFTKCGSPSKYGWQKVPKKSNFQAPEETFVWGNVTSAPARSKMGLSCAPPDHTAYWLGANVVILSPGECFLLLCPDLGLQISKRTPVVLQGRGGMGRAGKRGGGGYVYTSIQTGVFSFGRWGDCSMMWGFMCSDVAVTVRLTGR